MRRTYSWGRIDVVVEAAEDAPDYRIVLISSDFQSTSMAIDAHWGADHSARIAIDIHQRALTDPKRFLAEEKLESRHMPEEAGNAHQAWAQAIVHEAEILGDRLQEAIQVASQPSSPVDVTGRVEKYLELTEFGHEIAVSTLISEGLPLAEAKRIHADRTCKNLLRKWRPTPGRRLPTAARG